MKIKLCFLFLTIAFSLFSQNDNIYYLEINTDKGDTCSIYSDVANIREGAGINYPIVDKIKCGNEVSILDQVNETEIVDGISSPWIKIKYRIGNISKEGYIWGGNLSRKPLMSDDVKIVFGLDRTSNDDFVEGQIKAVSKNNEILSREHFKSKASSFFEGVILDDSKWYDTKIIKIMLEGEACGIPLINIFFVWNGSDLKYLLNTYSVGDLGFGNGYNHSERLIFPESYNDYDRMLIKYTMDDTGNYDLNYPTSVRVKTQIYHWDGNKLHLQNQNWKESDSF